MARVASYHDLKAGDWYFMHWSLGARIGNEVTEDPARVTHCVIRDPEGAMATLAIRGRATQANGSSWTWNEDLDSPTLSPSIMCPDGGWHGYLREGKWVEA